MGSGRFTCNVALRFPSLEPFLEESSNPLVPTVMMPLHLLREKQSYSPWEFHGAEELERLRHSIISDIVDLALPFIERYSRLTALQQRLESPSPRDWFILQPEGRLSILAVIRFVRGDKLDALRMLDDALLERKAAMPSKRLRLEAVRRRLAEAV